MNTSSAKHASREDRLTLELLDAIEQQEDISQRHLAKHMGVALGLANSYLKRCVKKGWIKITTAPANRYLYYLTPKGFAEKARLTAEFLSTSLTLFRQAGDSYTDLFERCERNGWRRVMLAGWSDLAEIAYLRSLEKSVEIEAVYAPGAAAGAHFGVPVWPDLRHAGDCQAAVLTSLERPLDMIERLRPVFDADRILVPDWLEGLGATAGEHTDPVAATK